MYLKNNKNFTNFLKRRVKKQKNIQIQTFYIYWWSILENREWEICKIIKILRNNQEIDKVIDILLENNCLYLLSKIIKIDIQPIMKIEKYVMESYKKQI